MNGDRNQTCGKEAATLGHSDLKMLRCFGASGSKRISSFSGLRSSFNTMAIEFPTQRALSSGIETEVLLAFFSYSILYHDKKYTARV